MSSTDVRELIVSRAELERDALAALPAAAPLVIATRRRFIDACDEMYIAAKLLGVDVPSHTTFADRADAWLWRTTRKMAEWRP